MEREKSREWGGAGPVHAARRAPFTGRAFAGPRSRRWDKGQDPSMGQRGPVNGTGLMGWWGVAGQ